MVPALTNRVAKWDNAKAILIFLVVFGHSIITFIDNELMRSVFLWITAFHMPLFMFLTGLFSKSFVRSEKFRGDKIASYVLLYFFMKLLIHISLGFVRSWGTFRWTSEGGTPWYIFVTAVFMTVTFLLKKFNPKKIFVITVILALFVGYIKEIGDEFMLSRIFVYYPYFFLGYMTDRDKLLGFINKWQIKLASAFVMIAFTFVIFYFGDDIFSLRYVFTGNNAYAEFGSDWKNYGIFLRAGCYIGSSLVSLAFLSLIPTKRIPFISYIGTKTLTIYALHRPVLYILQYTLMNQYMKDLSFEYDFLILFAGSLIITVLLALKPFDYVLYPCTKCDKWFAPVKKWLKK